MNPPARCDLIVCEAPAVDRGLCARHVEENDARLRRLQQEELAMYGSAWQDAIGLPRAYRGASLNNCPILTPAVMALRRYRDGRGVSRGQAVVLASITGGGKTFAACGLLNDALPWLHSRPRFMLAAELVRRLLDWDTVDSTMEEMATAPLLVLDDFQAPARPEGLALLEELLIRREADALPLIVTTNLRRKQFEAVVSDRIIDRLRVWGEYLELPGKSLRGGEAL